MNQLVQVDFKDLGSCSRLYIFILADKISKHHQSILEAQSDRMKLFETTLLATYPHSKWKFVRYPQRCLLLPASKKSQLPPARDQQIFPTSVDETSNQEEAQVSGFCRGVLCPRPANVSDLHRGTRQSRYVPLGWFHSCLGAKCGQTTYFGTKNRLYTLLLLG